MITVTFISHDGTARSIQASTGFTLMEAARGNDVPGIDAVCGGNCYCGTCRVRLSDEWLTKLPKPDALELEMLSATGDDDPSCRLSCQIRLDAALHELVAHTPEFQQ
jgi:ferredoxin, 2Fe-2S